MNETLDVEVFSRSYFRTGATASGKTTLGVALARAMSAQIVSLDSMAVYRGMDIGTAKPSESERCGVRHYLLDVVSPSESFSLADYLRLARDATTRIESSGLRALFVGGTPLYLKAMLFGVFESPQADEHLRTEFSQLVAQRGASALWEELHACDPVSAARLHENDVKRVSRALEVYRLTGRRASDLQRQFTSAPRVNPNRVFILTWEREKLYERINRRVDLMIEQGFLDETRRLIAEPNALGKTASQAVGYRELAQALRGEITLDEAIERIKRFTRNFAKRQETWFRSLETIGAQRVDATDRSVESLKDEILEKIKALEESER